MENQGSPGQPSGSEVIDPWMIVRMFTTIYGFPHPRKKLFFRLLSYATIFTGMVYWYDLPSLLLPLCLGALFFESLYLRVLGNSYALREAHGVIVYNFKFTMDNIMEIRNALAQGGAQMLSDYKRREVPPSDDGEDDDGNLMH